MQRFARGSFLTALPVFLLGVNLPNQSAPTCLLSGYISAWAAYAPCLPAGGLYIVRYNKDSGAHYECFLVQSQLFMVDSMVNIELINVG